MKTYETETVSWLRLKGFGCLADNLSDYVAGGFRGVSKSKFVSLAVADVLAAKKDYDDPNDPVFDRAVELLQVLGRAWADGHDDGGTA